MLKNWIMKIFVALGIFGVTNTVQAADPVKIWFSIPKTGIFASAGPSQMNAYLLWQDLVNAKGGLDIGGKGRRKIEFVHYDE